jgi:hypothetical protein
MSGSFPYLAPDRPFRLDPAFGSAGTAEGSAVPHFGKKSIENFSHLHAGTWKSGFFGSKTDF